MDPDIVWFSRWNFHIPIVIVNDLHIAGFLAPQRGALVPLISLTSSSARSSIVDAHFVPAAAMADTYLIERGQQTSSFTFVRWVSRFPLTALLQCFHVEATDQCWTSACSVFTNYRTIIMNGKWYKLMKHRLSPCTRLPKGHFRQVRVSFRPFRCSICALIVIFETFVAPSKPRWP